MSVGEALRRPELRQGFLVGAAFGGPVVAARLATRLARRRPPAWPVAGLVVTLSSVLVLERNLHPPPAALVAGLVLLALAGLVPLPWRIGAVVPGAVTVASAIPSSLPGWAPAVVAVGAVLGAATAPLVDRRHRAGVGPALMAGTALGAWACVPDVEQVGVVAGAAVAGALLSLLVPLRLGSAGAASAVGLVLWAGASGAVGRPAALVGAAAGLGLLVVGATVRPRGPTLRAGLVAVATQAALLAGTSRVAGLQTSVVRAGALAATALLVAAAVTLVVGAGSRRRGEELGPGRVEEAPG